MIVAYWIVAGLIAVVFLGAGAAKLIRSRDALVASGMGWAEDFSAGAVKLIGIAEVLGAIGLILPRLTGIAPILSPIAAVALAVLMVGAGLVHLRRREPPVPFALTLVAGAAAVLGFLTLS